MIIPVYPEHIQAQLDLLDEQIARIYAEELPAEPKCASDCFFIPNVVEVERIKKNLQRRIQPLLDEKVRLIQNSCPKYVVKE